MSFYDIYRQYEKFDLDGFFTGSAQAISGDQPFEVKRLLTFLSPKTVPFLEQIAQKAHEITVRNFGKTMQLYTPLYLSNYCTNECIYCGFNVKNPIRRKKLSLREVETEAAFIASTGLKHVLILTGSSREESPVSYIKDCVEVLKKYFTSISIEIYALTEDEYGELIESGVDGLTIYQEVYDRDIYDSVHLGGPKKDYLFRLDAPERAAKRGIRTINIGVLLGLADWRKEVFFAGLHAKYLQDNFPDTEVGVSLPRIRPHDGEFKPEHGVTDANIVQAVVALRTFMPRLGITLSTREDAVFRENLMPLGITKMSAGSTTAVGGHTVKSGSVDKPVQFEIFDERDVDEIKKMLSGKGYQPVLKDWVGV